MDVKTLPVHPAIGTRRKRYSDDDLLAYMDVDDAEYSYTEQAIKTRTYDYGPPDCRMTIIPRNGNGSDHVSAMSAWTGQLTTMQPKRQTHTKESLVWAIYDHQHVDTHSTTYPNDALSGACFALNSALQLFPASHMVVRKQSTESFFRAGSKVGSGRKTRADIIDVINEIRHLNNAVVDPATGLRCIIICPGIITSTKNWVFSVSFGIIIDQAAFSNAKKEEGDICDYNPKDFGAVVWTKKDPVLINGNWIKLPTLLVFDTRVIIPGNANFYQVYMLMPYLEAELKRYKGKHLSDDPKIRHAKRQQIHKKSLRRISSLVEMDVEELLDEEFKEHDSNLIVLESW